MSAGILVFAKAPVSGRSKTRLCPPCTPREAAALAEASLADTLAAVGATPGVRRVVVLDGEPGCWLPGGFEVIPQRGDGQDERLAAAFDDAGSPSILIGMDTPQVSPGLLAGAIQRLHTPGVGAVLGHAADGGWWVIGLRRPDPSVFVGVPMSSPVTGAAQRARLEALGLRLAEMPVLRDVDGFEDAREVARAIPGSAFAAAIRAVAGR